MNTHATRSYIPYFQTNQICRIMINSELMPMWTVNCSVRGWGCVCVWSEAARGTCHHRTLSAEERCWGDGDKWDSRDTAANTGSITCTGWCHVLCYVLCVMCYVLCVMCYMLYVMNFMLCVMCYVLCVICYVLCITRDSSVRDTRRFRFRLHKYIARTACVRAFWWIVERRDKETVKTETENHPAAALCVVKRTFDTKKWFFIVEVLFHKSKTSYFLIYRKK